MSNKPETPTTLRIQLAPTPSLQEDLKRRLNKAKIHAIAGGLAANELYLYLLNHPLLKKTGLAKNKFVKSLQGCVLGLGMLVGATQGFTAPTILKKHVKTLFSHLQPRPKKSAAHAIATTIANKQKRREASKHLRNQQRCLHHNYQTLFALGIAVGTVLTGASRKLAWNQVGFFHARTPLKALSTMVTSLFPPKKRV